MNRRDFNQALREAERARERRTLSPSADARLRGRLEREYERRRRPLVPLTIGALAVAATAVFAFVITRPALDGADEPGTFVAVKQASMDAPLLDRAGDVVQASGDAALRHRALRVALQAQDGAVVRREAEGLRVVSGTVAFDVEKRRPGEPNAAFFVSHGRIEVLGTRFTVVQRADGGEVTLHEGRIRFASPDGRTQVLIAGQSLRWPLPEPATAAGIPSGAAPMPVAKAPPAGIVPAPHVPPTAPATPAPAAPPPAAPPTTREQAGTPDAIASARPKAPRTVEPAPAPVTSAPGGTTAPALDVEALIEEIAVLRRKGQFDAAAERLEAALREPLSKATSERLSYELGSILTWQLKDTTRACEVWKAHRSAHPAGRYASEVQRARTSLGCE